MHEMCYRNEFNLTELTELNTMFPPASAASNLISVSVKFLFFNLLEEEFLEKNTSCSF